MLSRGIDFAATCVCLVRYFYPGAGYTFNHCPIYNFSIYRLFLSVNSTGLVTSVDFEPIYPGLESLIAYISWVRISGIAYFFNLFTFLSILLQCNLTLLSLLRFSYFITPYDAQTSSAFSALSILCNCLSVYFIHYFYCVFACLYLVM